jgi:RNA polymerase sigma-70 factor (ECF subfamily)
MAENDIDKPYVDMAQKGDKDAYGQLVTKYQKRLFRFLIMMLGQKDAAEDIMQESFVKAYLALGSFDSEKPFYPWLSTIAHNLAVNYMKKSAREKPASEYDDIIVSVPDKSDNPVNELIVRENDRQLMKAVNSLSEEFRIVFVLRMLEKMELSDIAEKLNIPRATVDSRLHRARQKLVELLKDFL